MSYYRIYAKTKHDKRFMALDVANGIQRKGLKIMINIIKKIGDAYRKFKADNEYYQKEYAKTLDFK